jgi:DNA-binding HxlR family transcriptional regulator
VLLALRRAPGQRLSAGALLRGSQVTAGAITNRVARLEKQGWVQRDIDPADRRQVLVTLTADGQRHADKILALKTTAEQRLLGRADRPPSSACARTSGISCSPSRDPRSTSTPMSHAPNPGQRRSESHQPLQRYPRPALVQ